MSAFPSAKARAWVAGMTTAAGARTEIERLLYTYAERIDAGDFAGVGALFAAGEIRAGDQTAGVGGATAVRLLYAATVRLYADGTPRTKHVTTNVVVDADEVAGTATARSYFTVLQQVDDFPLQVIVAGRYHDDFVRAAGVWRFAVRRMHVDLQGDLSRHLLVALPRPER
jgi:3-phenylpropionate/cinnamic acid dioxygenase small subunit